MPPRPTSVRRNTTVATPMQSTECPGHPEDGHKRGASGLGGNIPAEPAPVKRQRNTSAHAPARGRSAALGVRPDAVDRVSSRPEDGHETRCIRFTPRPNPRTRNVILRRRPPAYAAAAPHVSPREIRRCLRVHAPPLQPASAAERIVQRLVRSAVRCRHRRLGIRESFRSKTSGPP
jgi:hypothetical protein